MITDFKIGDFYSSEEIYKSLGVGNAGGVRISVGEHSVGEQSVVKRMVVFTSAPNARQLKENPYHDRIEGGILVYTGAGKEGDQLLTGVNRRFSEQQSELFPMYGFMILTSRRDKKQGPKRWRFLGMLEYLRQYQDIQIDARGNLRKAWMFEFRIHREPQTIPVESDRSISATILKSESSFGVSTEDDRQVAVTEESQESDPVWSIQDLEQVRSQLLSLDPRSFEFVIRDVLQRTDFDQVTVTKYSQDGGIDLNAYPSRQLWPIGGFAYSDTGEAMVAHRGTQRGRRAPWQPRSLRSRRRGYYQPFSKAATIEAASLGKNPIVLVDGIRFCFYHQVVGWIHIGPVTGDRRQFEFPPSPLAEVAHLYDGNALNALPFDVSIHDGRS